jgi:hypothetical protein
MPEFDFKKLKFEFDLSQADYQIDTLQNELLQMYLRADSRFRRAFSKNFTPHFLEFIKDKAKLHEPSHIATIGNVRSGKSFSMITLASFQMACYKKYFTIDNICANAYEFLEKLKAMPMEKSKDNCFVVDEEKQAVYGVGSVAKKIKLTDVQNIVAINNISTIMINPNSWANKEAMYGLRAFGRCFKTKTCRFMLYNLQEKGKGGELPLGCVYLPIFTAFLPKDYSDILEKQYLEKKMAWVGGELRGEGDVLADLKKKSAENFCRDKKFISLTKKKDRKTYISAKLGSEWTSKEIDEIENIAKLIQMGVL